MICTDCNKEAVFHEFDTFDYYFCETCKKEVGLEPIGLDDYEIPIPLSEDEQELTKEFEKAMETHLTLSRDALKNTKKADEMPEDRKDWSSPIKGTFNHNSWSLEGYNDWLKRKDKQ